MSLTPQTETTSRISVAHVGRMTGRVVIAFLVFDVVGVGLTLVAEAVAALDIVWESSALLGYAVWFVTGVFCAIYIYPISDDDKPDSPHGRRKGTALVVITAAVSTVLGFLSSFFWSTSGSGGAFAPDHQGVTITYLTTVVLVVAWARFVHFRERTPAVPALPAPSAARVRPKPNLKRPLVRARSEPRNDDSDEFKPLGFWGTLGLVIGVPMLLFLEMSFFVLGPFDYFDRWTDPLLTWSLIGGVVWGFAASRWLEALLSLLVLQAPLLLGAVFYVFALLLGGLLLVFGAPGRVSEIVSFVGFGLGFLLGCGFVVFCFATYYSERHASAAGIKAPAKKLQPRRSGRIDVSDDDPAQHSEFHREIEHLARTRNIPPSPRVK